MKSEPVEQQLTDAVPRLRAFAIYLSGSPASADDLVQETLFRATRHLDSIVEGTNISAGLFKILRKVYGMEYRRFTGSRPPGTAPRP